jgi:hypothetical protein
MMFIIVDLPEPGARGRENSPVVFGRLTPSSACTSSAPVRYKREHRRADHQRTPPAVVVRA